MVSPASTEAASATLVMAMAPQLTVIPTGPTEAEPSLEVVTEAELLTTPQVAWVVGEVMWTWVLAPPARLAGPKDSTPAVMLHPAVELAVSLHDALPVLVGRVSDTV